MANKRLTILTVVRWPVGGIRTYLRDLFNSAALQDLRFVLVAPNEAGLDQYLAEGHFGPVEWVASGSTVKEMTRALVRVGRELRPAFVHSHGFISGAISALGCSLVHLPHLLTVHDLLLDEQFVGWRGQLRRLGVGASLWSPDYVHCVTDDSRTNLIATYPWVPRLRRNIVVIPHGVDVPKIVAADRRDLAAAMYCTPETVIFGFLGRFMAQKGFRTITDAVGLLKKRGISPQQMRVLAVGSGGFIREDTARIRDLGLEEYFVFWPYQPDIAPILKGMRCLLMPSLWEASGLLAMEAMVAGIPVIGSNCLGLRETLADSPAVRVRPNDANELSDAMAVFISYPAQSAAQAFQAEAARRFSAERAFRELRDLYRQMPQRER